MKISVQNGEAERMLAFTNNSGPLFIIGTVGIALYRSSLIGIILFITHILACITVGIIFGFYSRHFSKKVPSPIHSKSSNLNTTHTYTLSNLGEILSTSITNAISTILLIGGFIVLFSIIISIINKLNINFIFEFFNISSTYSTAIFNRFA